MITLNLPKPSLSRYIVPALTFILSVISAVFYVHYLHNGLALSYNDARSHLDIGRRVVEGLKPGLAQLGSVWLPLNHILMIPTIWNDFMWHSGLAGAIQSMISFVATGLLIYKYLARLKVGILGRLIGVSVFVANVNILYMQSTAMTELLLLATMTAGCYFLLLWHQDDNLINLVQAAFWIMLSTLIRYDGWFLLFIAAILVFIQVLRKHSFKQAEGETFFFVTLGALGIVLWLLWNAAIFKDPLYFVFGPFAAHTQQEQLAQAGNLPTLHNIDYSTTIYLYALLYNSYTLPAIFALAGVAIFLFDERLDSSSRISTLSLLTPFVFNIIALYLGFSVLFIQGLSGETWFNVRYGIMLMPSIGIFIGYLFHRLKDFRWMIAGLLIFVIFFGLANQDAVTVDDARVGSSQKNVSEVAGYLASHAQDQPGYILISVASHDAIIFSSGLPMSRFIHEGTGAYWIAATTAPDRWARWIVMRTYDNTDLTWKFVSKAPGFKNYHLVKHYPFADVYELNNDLIPDLHFIPLINP